MSNYGTSSNRIVGEGSQAKVFSDGIDALPVVHKIFPRTNSGFQAFQKESLAIQSLCGKKGIVEMENISHTNEGFCVTMKKYDMDLFDYAFVKKMIRSEEEAKPLLRSICEGVQNMHQSGVAHLDIKPENILIDCNSKKAFLCDFGLSYVGAFKSTGAISGLGLRGTPEYLPPEIMISPNSYDPFAADMFSLGCTLFALLTGYFPCGQADLLFSETMDISSHLQSLLISLLNPVPGKRPTIEEVLRHPAFQRKRRGSVQGFCASVCKHIKSHLHEPCTFTKPKQTYNKYC